MITLQQFEEMFEMQDRLNCEIDKNWRYQDRDWCLAIAMEANEAIDHHGWKWWKAKGSPNVEQIKLEVVDIWHFLLSCLLEESADIEQMYEILAEVDSNVDELSLEEYTIINLLKELSAEALQDCVELDTFYLLFYKLGMTTEELYKLYVSKNVLNQFRQDNGYKEGTYTKQWGFQEDNEVMYSLLDQASINNYQQELYTLLNKYYADYK